MRREKRLMVFIDGTNFLIELSKKYNLTYRAENPPLEIFTICYRMIRETLFKKGLIPGIQPIRNYWFASYQGSEKIGDAMYAKLRDLKFEPILFKKHRDKKEKGVDIELTKEMLVNAFNDNYNIAVLFAGDEDYVNLVQEVKRYGAIIIGSFFENGLSPKLKVTFDEFLYICSNDGIHQTIKELKGKF